MTLARRCFTCGQVYRTTRCPCRTMAARGYDTEWRRISRAARAAHPWCARCGATTDLTTDHVVPGDRSELRVLCRTCHGLIGAQANRG